MKSKHFAIPIILISLILCFMLFIKDTQVEQREKIKATFTSRGALLSYRAPRKVQSIPVINRLSSYMLEFGISEFSGILAIDDPIVDNDLKVLPGYKNLRSLTLENSQITNNGIKYLISLPNLEDLNLSKCNIDDSCIDDLLKIPKMDTLFINGTQISRKGYIKLRARLITCSIFSDHK